MKTFHIACCVFAVAAALRAVAVTVCYEGRLLSSGGEVLRNATKSATVTAYDGETGGTKISDDVQATIKTDSEGIFAVAAELDVPSANAVFWVGVNVDGVDVKPRMRVNPAPFALVAAEAERIETDGALKLSGNVAVGSISNDAATVGAKTVVLGGDTVVRGNVEKSGDVYIGTLDAGKGNVGMMRTAHPGNIATSWNSFAGDSEFSATTGGSLLSTSDSATRSLVARDDGFAMVMVKADVGNSTGSIVDVAIDNGDFSICSMGPSDSTDSSYFAVGTDRSDATVVRMFTFPVRRGKSVSVSISCKKNLFSSATATGAAKVSIVYFGANR